MEEILQLGLCRRNHFAYIFEEVASLLKVAITCLNQAQTLLYEVGLVGLVVGMQLVKNAVDLLLAILDLRVLNECELL